MGRSGAALSASIAGLTCLGAAASCLDSKNPPPGEVMVVVTTDMSVQGERPDFDTVNWMVSTADEPDAGGGSFGAAQLPATLGIATGKDPSAYVTIVLDGLSGGTNGSGRVHRVANLTAMPVEGVKMLSMPLDWLCSSGANPGQTCGSGLTCQAGLCVNSDVTSTLADYVAVESAACTLPAAAIPPGPEGALDYCFASAALVKPTLDPKTKQCTISTPNGTAQVNVALVLDSGGTCGNAVGCLIPLDGESPEGWQTTRTDAGTRAINLPTAVCDDIDGGTIANVAITTACPTKDTDAPLCPRSGSCVAFRPVDPRVGCLGNLGYACASSTTSPGTLDSQLGGSASQPGGPTTYLSCYDVPQKKGSPLLIDDMSDVPADGGLPQIKFPPLAGYGPGHWSAPFTYSAGGACISSGEGPAQEGFDFGELADGGAPAVLDAHGYSGISFWAFSPYVGQGFGFGFRTTMDVTAPTDGGPCPGGGRCENGPALTDKWAPYVVKWADLGPGFDAAHLMGAYFYASTPVFDLCVSQIYFTP